MRRFGQHAELKPEKVAEYVALHAAVWPEVLAIISACNMRNYSIYQQGTHVFCYFEYTGEDYEADLKKMEAEPKMQEWWTHTKPCFVGHDQQEYYLDWTEIFHLA